MEKGLIADCMSSCHIVRGKEPYFYLCLAVRWSGEKGLLLSVCLAVTWSGERGFVVVCMSSCL